MDACEAPPNKKPRTKPKVVKDWEDEDVFKLITFVESQPCLWNAGDEGYHNKMLRDNAWKSICEGFEDKFSQIDVNAKWTNLRIQYRGYAARAKTKSGQGYVEQPKWKFFNAMSFVGRVEDQQTQRTISNYFSEVESDCDISEFNLPSAIYTTPSQTSRRQQTSSSQSATTQIAETMREAISAMKDKNENALNPNATFANYLLSELKTLNDDSAAIVRKKVTLFFLQCLDEARN
ncbi:uncharacterized protein LOC142223552 [Haematobia irritans]|uniref:uncharacterized protein LOC142223552 n=1 Tax=Haematobia irritans TaxID=7368 RepID=UPI003F508A9A